MTLPRISIITPSFNQGKYIEQTISSIVEQGYPDYELIIIDGGSTDNTLDIIRTYESRITYWISEKDNGQADAINKGLAKATGEIFNWINSDDYLEPGALQTVGEYFSKHPEKQALCGYTRCFFEEDNSTSHIYRMGLKKTVTDTILNVEMNQPGTFYRTDAVKAVGGVNASLRYVFDNELWFRMLAKYGLNIVGVTDKLLAQFRLHKDSKSVFEGYERFNEESKAIYLFLARQLHLSPAIIRLLEEEVSDSAYEAAGWDYSFIHSSTLEDFFSAKYMLSLMQQGYYHAARMGWKYRSKKHLFAESRMLWSSFIKLFLLPDSFKKNKT